MELKYKNPEAIREALGLIPWEVVKAGNLSKDPSDLGRNTGITTRMLIDAIFTSQTCEVEIRGKDGRSSVDLVIRAKEMCEKLGLPTNNISYWHHLSTSRNVFTDHSYDSVISHV